MRDLRLLIDSATDRGVAAEWASTKGLNRARRSYGYGRYIRLAGTDVWFGVNRDRWEQDGQTPLGLDFLRLSDATLREISATLEVPVDDRWVPIMLKTDVEYSEQLDDVVSKLKVIAEIIKNR